jgi:hypothetical protein
MGFEPGHVAEPLALGLFVNKPFPGGLFFNGQFFKVLLIPELVFTGMWLGPGHGHQVGGRQGSRSQAAPKGGVGAEGAPAGGKRGASL